MKSAFPRQGFSRLAFALLAANLTLASACGSASDSGVAASGGESGSGGKSGSGGAPVGGSTGTSLGGESGGLGGVQGGGAAGTSDTGTGGRGSGGPGSGGRATGGANATGGSGGVRGTAGSPGASGGSSAAGAGGSQSGATYDPCPPAPTDCKIMPFGDSITDGYLAQRGGYRIPLFQRAHQEGKHLTFVGSALNGPAMVDGVPFPQHHEGHSAYTINDEPLPAPAHNGIAPFVKTSIPAYHPDIVLLMIGTNDVDNSIDLPNVPTRLGALIDSIIALDAHTLIVVAQITPTMQDPLNARISAYNAAIPAVVKARADAGKHVAMVDMYSAFVSDRSYKTTLLFDRLHPNIPGFQRMADTWNTVIHDLVH
jgi:lysophospholipase L1-like esterase